MPRFTPLRAAAQRVAMVSGLTAIAALGACAPQTGSQALSGGAAPTVSAMAPAAGAARVPVMINVVHGGQPVSGATCLIGNDRGQVRVTPPAVAEVPVSAAPLRVACSAAGLVQASTLVLAPGPASDTVLAAPLLAWGPQPGSATTTTAATGYPGQVIVPLARVDAVAAAAQRGSSLIDAGFAAADSDGDGRVSRAEYDTALATLAGAGLTPPATAFTGADSDGDGSLTLAEARALGR